MPTKFSRCPLDMPPMIAVFPFRPYNGRVLPLKDHAEYMDQWSHVMLLELFLMFDTKPGGTFRRSWGPGGRGRLDPDSMNHLVGLVMSHTVGTAGSGLEAIVDAKGAR